MKAIPRERNVRWLTAAVALGFLALALSAVVNLRPDASRIATPDWSTLAPPATVRINTWRWLVITSGPRAGAHFVVGPMPGDPARITALSAWQLQQPATGTRADAIVVAIDGRGDDPAIERSLAVLGAVLVRNLPTLPLRQIGADRQAPPPGLDQDRLRFRIRGLLEARRTSADGKTRPVSNLRPPCPASSPVSTFCPWGP